MRSGAADPEKLGECLEERGLARRVGTNDGSDLGAQRNLERIGTKTAEAGEGDAFETQETSFRWQGSGRCERVGAFAQDGEVAAIAEDAATAPAGHFLDHAEALKVCQRRVHGRG